MRRAAKIVLAVVIVLVLVAAAWYYTYRYGTDVVEFDDGNQVTTPHCGKSYRVVKATYGPRDKGKSCKSVNVTKAAEDLFNKKSAFVVSAGALGVTDSCNGVRTLHIRYRCK